MTELTNTTSTTRTTTQAVETAATFVARLTLAEADHSPGYLAVGLVRDAWVTVTVSTRGTYEVRAELPDGSDHAGEAHTLGDLGSWLDQVAPSPAADYRLTHNEAALVEEFRQDVANLKAWDQSYSTEYASVDEVVSRVLGANVEEVRAKLPATSKHGSAPVYLRVQVYPADRGERLPQVVAAIQLHSELVGADWFGSLGSFATKYAAFYLDALADVGRTEAVA